MSSFYFGYQGNLQSVKVPTTGLERAQQAYRASGTLTNGGGWVRSSAGGHYTYVMNWDFIRNADYAQIRALYDYGELIHFLDPQAAVSNALPSYVAQAGDAARGGYRLIGYADAVTISEISTLAPLVTTGPARTVRYSAITGAPRKQVWLPVPTGHTLHLRGLAAGTAQVQLTGNANLLTDPTLLTASMSTNGATVVDTHPTTGGPADASPVYFRRTMTTANTTSPMSAPMAPSGTGGIPVSPGDLWTFSAYPRKSAGGPTARLDVTWYTAAGASISTTSSTPVTPGVAFSRISHTYTVPATAAFARPSLVWSGIALVAQTLDWSSAQFEFGAVATPWSNGLLPVSDSTTTSAPVITAVPSGSAQGVYLTIGAGDTADIRWLQTKVLPTGEAAVWDDWMPGLGHSGCRLDDVPSYTLYSAPQAIDFGALGLTLRETGAWE